MSPLVDFEEWEAEQLRDPAFVAAVAERDPAYQVTRLRILHGLTQAQLAELTGTKPASIARLERGMTPLNLSFLRKVAAALGARVEVKLLPTETAATRIAHLSDAPVDELTEQAAFDITQTRTWELGGSLEVAEPEPEYVVGRDEQGRPITNYAEHVDDVLH